MKIFVKTLKGTNFSVEVKPEDKVSDVKENIEKSQGACVYPADQQMLIYQGKVLKDTTTLEENKVVEDSFVVIMLTKKKSSSGDASTTTAPTTSQAPPTSSVPPTTTVASTTTEAPAANLVPPPAAPVPAAAPVAAAPFVTSLAPSVPAPISQEADVYGQAASNLVAGNNFEEAIQQILDMGGGTWDRDTVIRALRAAFNNPERAVDYLYSGIPEQPEVPPATQPPMGGLAANLPAQVPQPADPIPPSGPNANPLNLFPQGLPNVGSNTAGSGNLDFLRNNVQFQALRSMVQANPQILQPMLQELGKQNPQLVRLIQEHQADFLNLINEPVEGEEDVLGQLAAGMPQQVAVTPEERDAIERLEAMGFDRAIVLEVFFACNKNEELAANYLLDHSDEFE